MAQIPQIKIELLVDPADHGFGPPDNPDLDATDGAHPAWWRGCDHGSIRTAKVLQRVAEGEVSCATGIPPTLAAAAGTIEALRARVVELEADLDRTIGERDKAELALAPTENQLTLSSRVVASAIEKLRAFTQTTDKSIGLLALCDRAERKQGEWSEARDCTLRRAGREEGERVGGREAAAIMATRLKHVAMHGKVVPAWRPGDPGLEAADAIQALRQRVADLETSRDAAVALNAKVEWLHVVEGKARQVVQRFADCDQFLPVGLAIALGGLRAALARAPAAPRVTPEAEKPESD